jgi:RNA-directed DNA polymerase
VGKLKVTVAMNKPKLDSVQLNTEGWKTINWRKAQRYVFKLQKRIYAASRRGDVKQCRKLQHTLMRSWYNRLLSVRRVTQENLGKKTAGVDGVKSLSPEARLKLARELKPTGKSKPTRRVWIPKPGKQEKRPLSIPTMHDRALQAVIKSALEPEWEAVFEPNSYGFRPGRSCHDAIKQIKLCIQNQAKFVLDTDIAKCYDCINHLALLEKLNIRGKVRQQIKSWLKSGVIDSGVFTATSEGTPQGGVISPLLANIALHGLENALNDFATTLDMRDKHGKRVARKEKIKSLSFIRYADDFVVLHKDLAVVTRCREIISEWLLNIGLELKPSKTRLTHTFINELSEDGKAGFDFLGHHIQQYPAGKYRSNRNAEGKILGFNTLITPSKNASKVHQQEIGRIITKHRSSPQTALIKDLNPVIRGWTSYYSNSDAKNIGELTKQDNLTYLKLRRWAIRRCKSSKDAHNKYWTYIGSDNWVFATKEGTANSLRLLKHREFACSSTSYVKVKGDKSPYDGDLIYWSSRLGRHPQMPGRKASVLKKQKGKCPWCGLRFLDWDVIEEDHIIPKAIGGLDKYDNLQLLHRHCHDEKTRNDLVEIRKINHSKFLGKLSQFWDKYDWEWIDDMPSYIGYKDRKSLSDK